MPDFLQQAQQHRQTPDVRIRAVNEQRVRESGAFVLYWMVANRRTRWNFSLQRAVEWAAELNKPLVILEALRADYPWSSPRLHYFVVQGMVDNARALADSRATYFPYLEHEPGAGQGLLPALADHACLVVTDDFPCFFLPRMLQAAARRLGVRLEAVDSNGLLPMRAADKVFLRAYDFRRFLQRELAGHLRHFPQTDPLAAARLPKLACLPSPILDRWPEADVETLARSPESLARLPLQHEVPIVEQTSGGPAAADRRAGEFLQNDLPTYAEGRNDPDHDRSSRFSPYLHFGHLSTHQVFAQLADDQQWSPSQLADTAKGNRSGWWGLSESAEAFLDEVVTWRELGYNMAWQQHDFRRYSSLPDWAQGTLADHADDPRESTYSLAEFEQAETHDELWNAAQRQLLAEGRIHNYLRMLWGKKILQWSATPQAALAAMIELNNKYALDGRNPNSYSGIFWVLGRYDRPWGPERPVFGKVRYMSSENTARKAKVKEYLKRYSADAVQQ